jgi:hypothetical protein
VEISPHKHRQSSNVVLPAHWLRSFCLQKKSWAVSLYPLAGTDCSVLRTATATATARLLKVASAVLPSAHLLAQKSLSISHSFDQHPVPPHPHPKTTLLVYPLSLYLLFYTYSICLHLFELYNSSICYSLRPARLVFARAGHFSAIFSHLQQATESSSAHFAFSSEHDIASSILCRMVSLATILTFSIS